MNLLGKVVGASLSSLPVDEFRQWFQAALNSAKVSTVDALKDDEVVRAVSNQIYRTVPFVPRMALRTAVGEQAFERLVFKIRDRMLENNSLDLSWLNSTVINMEDSVQKSQSGT